MDMVNYGFGMPTRLVADGDVARWCGRLVAHYGGTRVLVIVPAETDLREGVARDAIGSLDRALLDRSEFRCADGGAVPDPSLIEEIAAQGADDKVDFVLAVGGVGAIELARAVAERLAELSFSADGFFPYGGVLTHAKRPRAAGEPCDPDKVPVFVIVAPELLDQIDEPLRGALVDVCGAA